MHQRPGLPIRELKKGDYQSGKTGYRYYVEQCRHLAYTAYLLK